MEPVNTIPPYLKRLPAEADFLDECKQLFTNSKLASALTKHYFNLRGTDKDVFTLALISKYSFEE